MLCSRCGQDTSGRPHQFYVIEDGVSVRVCEGCVRGPKKIDNPFHELGFPDVHRVSPEKGKYVWEGKD